MLCNSSNIRRSQTRLGYYVSLALLLLLSFSFPRHPLRAQEAAPNTQRQESPQQEEGSGAGSGQTQPQASEAQNKSSQKEKPTPALLDVLTLKDGSQLGGKIIAVTFATILFRGPNGKMKAYPKSKLARMCFGRTWRKCSIQTGWDRLWRSALLPGWGQWAGRSYTSAWVFGSLFGGLSLAALHFGNVADENGADAKKLIEESNADVMIDPQIKLQEDSAAIADAKQKAEDAAGLRDALWGGAAFVYLLQLYHAYYNGFIPPSSSKKRGSQSKKLADAGKGIPLLSLGRQASGFFFTIEPGISSGSARQSNFSMFSNQRDASDKIHWGYHLAY